MTRQLLVVITTIVASASAHADSGVYVGTGLTEGRASNVYGLNAGCSGCPVWSLNATSWEAMLGWRPFQALAVEAKYESLGTSSTQLSHGDAFFDAKAAGVYAMGYIPLPLPVLELYGKAGLVHAELDGHSYTFAPRSNSATEFAAGAGVQAHLLRVSFRLEVERFNIPQTSNAYVFNIAGTCDIY